MADAKLSAETELTQGNLAAGDLLYVVDVSDTTDGAGGSSRKIQATNLLAPAKLTPITNASPADGDVWYGSNQKALSAQLAGNKNHLVGCVYTQGADVTVTTNGSDQSLCGDTNAVGSRTIKGGSLVVGKTLRISIRGFLSTAATAGTCLPKLALGTTVVAAATAGRALAASRTNELWEATIWLTCRSTGASGTVVAQGRMNVAASASSDTPIEMPNSGTVTLDTTADQIVNFTINLSATGNSFTSQIMMIEALN